MLRVLADVPGVALCRRSGTTSRMTRAETAVMVARTANTPRQPIWESTISAGAVAVTAPSAPSMMNQPLASAMRSGGNHRTIALRPAIRAPDTEADQAATDGQRGESVGRRKECGSRCRNGEEDGLDP